LTLLSSFLTLRIFWKSIISRFCIKQKPIETNGRSTTKSWKSRKRPRKRLQMG